MTVRPTPSAMARRGARGRDGVSGRVHPGVGRRPSVDRGLQVQRVRDLLRVAVIDRATRGGELRLPAEPDLMREFAAPRDVIREALGLLAAEGLIARRRGVGTVVIGAGYTVDGALPSVSTSLTDHVGIGAVAARLLHWRHEPVPAVVADRLDGVAPGADALCMEYVLTLAGRPMGLITNYLRPREAAGMRPEEFGDDFYGLLDAHGIDLHSHDIEVAAQAADARVAHVLGVAVGAPMQLFEQSIHDSTGACFDFAIGRLRSEMRMRITGIGRLTPAVG